MGNWLCKILLALGVKSCSVGPVSEGAKQPVLVDEKQAAGSASSYKDYSYRHTLDILIQQAERPGNTSADRLIRNWYLYSNSCNKYF